MLAYVRGCLRGSEGEEFRIPTTALDEVLDERGQCGAITVGSEVIVGGAAPRGMVVAMQFTLGRGRWCRGGAVGSSEVAP